MVELVLTMVLSSEAESISVMMTIKLNTRE